MTFITFTGLYCYKHIAFGLSSAPSCFQKIMTTVLAGCPDVVVDPYDSVLHGPDTAAHCECLWQVFTSLNSHHLTLNSDKCEFSASAIDFVGFWVSSTAVECGCHP